MTALLTLARGLATALPVAFAVGWIGTRHNDRARANARSQLAEMGAACPDDGDGFVPPFNLVDIRDVYTPEVVADFDLWGEQVKA